jgi:hypothetical protein
LTTDITPNETIHHRYLGGILSRYAPHLLLWGIFLGIGLFLAILGLARPNAGTLLPGALIFVASFGALIPIYLGLARTPRSAHTSPEGVRWLSQLSVQHCAWNDISAVYRMHKIINQTFHVKKLRLVLADGREVTFDQTLSDYDRLAEMAQETVAQQLLPSKRLELARAGAEFGAVTLHRDGLTINAKKLSWPDIEQYIVFRGNLVVYPKAYLGISCAEVILSTLPNYTVLLHLLQELGQMPVPPERSILFLGRR